MIGYVDDLIGYVPDPKAYAGTPEYSAVVVPKIMSLPCFKPEVGLRSPHKKMRDNCPVIV